MPGEPIRHIYKLGHNLTTYPFFPRQLPCDIDACGRFGTPFDEGSQRYAAPRASLGADRSRILPAPFFPRQKQVWSSYTGYEQYKTAGKAIGTGFCFYL